MAGLRNNLHNVGIDRIPGGGFLKGIWRKVKYANATLLHMLRILCFYCTKMAT
jgi:hypothetical protein